MDSPVINRIPLVRKTILGWIVLFITYILIVLFTSLQSNTIPKTISIGWNESHEPIAYASSVFLICVTIIPSTVITILSAGLALMPLYNNKLALIPYKEFWLSIVNVEKTSFILIWLSLLIGIASNILSFSLFYPIWHFNMKCMDISIEQCSGNYLYIPQIIIYLVNIICYFVIINLYFFSPPQKEGKLLESGDLEEEGGWKREVLYFNPFNPVLFLHKRLGMGWTCNLGNPWITVFAMGIIMIIAAMCLFVCVFVPLHY
ncbi:hypothetical protein WA158_000642 [Blastocystis sp. Blastoise]